MSLTTLPRGRVVRALALALLFDAAGARSRAVAQPPGPSPASWSTAQAPDTGAAIHFRLSDQFGRVYDAAEYRGRALLLVGAASGGRAIGTAWVEALRALQTESAGAVVVPVVGVADLRGVPRLLRRFARGKFPSDRRQPVLLDWDGAVARRLAFDRERCTILVVGPTGTTYARSSPGAVDTAVARALLLRAASLTPAAISGGR